MEIKCGNCEFGYKLKHPNHADYVACHLHIKEKFPPKTHGGANAIRKKTDSCGKFKPKSKGGKNGRA